MTGRTAGAAPQWQTAAVLASALVLQDSLPAYLQTRVLPVFASGRPGLRSCAFAHLHVQLLDVGVLKQEHVGLRAVRVLPHWVVRVVLDLALGLARRPRPHAAAQTRRRSWAFEMLCCVGNRHMLGEIGMVMDPPGTLVMLSPRACCIEHAGAGGGAVSPSKKGRAAQRRGFKGPPH